MAKKQSFLDRVQPNRAREKLIDWPFETSEPVKVKMRVLGCDELEAAHLEAADHFRALKQKFDIKDDVFVLREHVGLVWRAYETEDGDRLADDTAALASWPMDMIMPLYAEWSQFQGEVTARPAKQVELDELVEGLKKNTLADRLLGLPSTSLIKLVLTLASQLAASTTESGSG